MFKKPKGMLYTRFLNSIHASHMFDWYMEIGCRTGDSFAPVRSKTIAVDPFFRAETNIIGAKPALHIFQQTSDDFFAGGFLARNGIKLSFSFIDGMHLVEYALRDLINVEANSAPSGVIAIHDCCPFTTKMTTRDLSNLPEGPWTGDVWKLLPILRRYRPDLTVTVLNCRSSGLVLVSDLDPTNRVLADNLAEILAEYQEISMEDFGLDRFNDCFEYTDASQNLADGFPQFAACRIEDSAAIKPVFVSP